MKVALFSPWHYVVDIFLSVYKMTSFFVMAAWCSVEWEYHNLFNGHYDCLEFFSATEV